jgi:hypothetical protein
MIHNSSRSRPTKWVSSTFIAEIFGTCNNTILNWANDGILPPAVQVRRVRRWRLADIIQFARDRGIHLTQDGEVVS